MAKAPLRRLIRFGQFALALIALAATGYPAAGWLGSSIPRGSGTIRAPAASDITIMLESNGTHTGIVVPLANGVKDWRETFPSAAGPRQHDGTYPTHLGIGWGEREVFLNVPTWSDLEISTALRIAILGGEPLMRVSHYANPRPSQDYRPIRISAGQYARLVGAIEDALPSLPAGTARPVLRGSYAPDAYYKATGSYTLVNTCNNWVGNTLAATGIEMGMWTPFAAGVSKWIPSPEDDL